ncbi:MAG: hypothetical protein AB1941_03410 [Gemmatimonadota bacterium]
MARLHHCIADGIALIHLLLTLDDVEGNESAAALWGLNGGTKAGLRPAAPWPRLLLAAAASLARLVLMPPDLRSAFRGPLRPAKRAAWSRPVPLDELRAVAKSLGCTLHDVLATALAGRWGATCGPGGRTRLAPGSTRSSP